MKHLIVFFLIAIMAFQWLGSLFTISLVDAIVVKTTITAKERYITEHLSEKYNLSSEASFSEVNPANYVRMGYGAPFIFSEEISGELSHFSINNEDTKLLMELKELSLADFQQNANPHLFNCFFPIFLMVQNPAPIDNTSYVNTEHLSVYSAFYQSVYLSIPLPPPNSIV